MSQVDYVRVLEDGLAAADTEIQLLRIERDWWVERLIEVMDGRGRSQCHGLKLVLGFVSVWALAATLILVLKVIGGE